MNIPQSVSFLIYVRPSGWGYKIFPSLLPPKGNCDSDIYKSYVNSPLRVPTFMPGCFHTTLCLWESTVSCVISICSFSSLLTPVLVLVSTYTSTLPFSYIVCGMAFNPIFPHPDVLINKKVQASNNFIMPPV